MVSIDPDKVIELATEMNTLKERVLALRADLFSGEGGLFLWDDMDYLGSESAPWTSDLTASWNAVIESRSAEADEVEGVLDKIQSNLLYAAAAHLIGEGESVSDFAGTGESLEEHASGEYFQDW